VNVLVLLTIKDFTSSVGTSALQDFDIVCWTISARSSSSEIPPQSEIDSSVTSASPVSVAWMNLVCAMGRGSNLLSKCCLKRTWTCLESTYSWLGAKLRPWSTRSRRFLLPGVGVISLCYWTRNHAYLKRYGTFKRLPKSD